MLSILLKLLGSAGSVMRTPSCPNHLLAGITQEAIKGGKNKKTGGHDHRTNTGDDRTPAQKEGDKKRRKSPE